MAYAIVHGGTSYVPQDPLHLSLRWLCQSPGILQQPEYVAKVRRRRFDPAACDQAVDESPRRRSTVFFTQRRKKKGLPKQPQPLVTGYEEVLSFTTHGEQPTKLCRACAPARRTPSPPLSFVSTAADRPFGDPLTAQAALNLASKVRPLRVI